MAKADSHLWNVLDANIDMLRTERRLSDAINVAEKALEVARRGFVENDLRLAKAADKLGELYKEAGEFKKAEPLCWEAHDIYCEWEPRDEAALARVSSNLALIHDALGHEEDALRYYEEAVPMVEKLYGCDNLNYATLINNLAMIYKARQQLGKAETLYLRALSIYQKLHRVEHPDTASLLNNLGVFYTEAGEYDKAGNMHWRALNMRRNLYGNNHPEVAQSVSNLAVWFHAQGDFKEAAAHYKEALALLEKQSPLDVDQCKTVAQNYADLLRAEGRERKAVALEERVKTLEKQGRR